MAKTRSSAAKLAQLRDLRGQSPSPKLIDELRTALRDASNLVVSEAAEIAGEARLMDLNSALVEAYERFLIDAEKKDKLCRAKIAIVEALNKMEYDDAEFYLRGIHYVQSEPAYGGPVDTAVPIRVACAFALVHLRHRNVLALLVDMLSEAEKGARVGAVQALANSGAEAAALLLRLKARLGDKEPEVISECFTGIIELAAEQGIPFVAEFLDSREQAIQESALMALGSSRKPAAFEIIKSFAERNIGDVREVAYTALALLRLPPATNYLLSLLVEPSRSTAAAALTALAVQRYDPHVRERVAAVVVQRGDQELQALWKSRFPVDER